MGKIRRDDEVIVISGSGKGRRGKVLRVLDGDRVVVSGVRLVKRHTRPNPQANVPGGIVEREAPIHVSNVALVDPATDKAARVGYKVLEDKTKIRIFRSTGAAIDG